MKQPYICSRCRMNVWKTALLMVLYFFVCNAAELKAQCNFTKLSGFGTITRDLDSDVPPFATNVVISGATLGPSIDITSPNVSIDICFWGDMDTVTENFNVMISGQIFTTGGFGFTPTAGAPACRNFVLPAGVVETDLADGDIDISYQTFGTAWTNGTVNGNNVFNARVQSVSFTFNIVPTISIVGDTGSNGTECQDGTDLDFNGSPADGATTDDMASFDIFPATPSFNKMTGVLDVSATPAGDYNIVYTYVFNGCTFERDSLVTIYAVPVANLAETLIDCKLPGSSLELGVMFDGSNDNGGTFNLVSGMATLMGSTMTVPAGGGCFTIRYQVLNPNACPNAPYRDDEELLITTDPQPAFTIMTATPSPICQAGGMVPVTITNVSMGPNQMLTINGMPAIFGVNNLPAPAMAGSIIYNVCLQETNTYPAVCGTTLPDPDLMDMDVYVPCTTTFCQSITIYNDGINCGADAPFPSECEPDPDATEVCEVETVPSLDLSCSFFSLSGPNLIDAELDPVTGIITCEDDEVCFDWSGSLPGSLGPIATGGPRIRDLNIAANLICRVITFEICIPLPFVSDICIDPVPLGQYEDACDQTLGQFIFGTLGTLLGGDGGGGMIVADTDGDGNFDYVAEEYAPFPASSDAAGYDQACIPNNVQTPQGTITVRNVVSWPFAPEDVCGAVTTQEINLLELLPIAAIPLVGPIIEDLLAAASCNVNLVFSDEETVEIPVLNTTPPVFANCNEAGYVFSEDLICSTEANWSIPVAYDGCYGGILNYQGRTVTTDATSYEGTAPAVVTVTGSGLYQTAGPIPGSDLAPGTYFVTYTAYSCSGVPSACTFNVSVSPGDPVLVCPNNVIARMDVDECTTYVTGLSPVQGIGCATAIVYAVDYPAVPGFPDIPNNATYSPALIGTHNDASGLQFPEGVTTVTYTMWVDLNGDGDVDDPNETQTCSFTITVEDSQRPTALCIDIEVQLDNTGNIEIFADDQNDGSPYVNGGSTDNCPAALIFEIAEPGGIFGPSIVLNCDDVGNNIVNLRVRDQSGNSANCIAQIKVEDFFEGVQLQLDLPELCLEANNPAQLDFSNYLNITLPDGTVIKHQQVATNNYLGDAVGAFGITAFAPAPGSSNDPGTISPDGVYAPGTGTGFVTVSYVVVLPGVSIPQNGNIALAGCLEIVHATFELRQPLQLGSPECECFVEERRAVALGTITGGLEPYTIHYSGTVLDLDGDGVAEDSDGQYTYSAANGHNLTDFEEDLGSLSVVYTQPTWSFTIVDARGCELFRSGSCDNDDFTEGPTVVCPLPSNVNLTTEEYLCESQYDWEHPLPSDNCAVVLYDYRIINPDGTIDGPHNLNALLNILDPAPVEELFDATYEFQLGVSTVYYYAEDAQGNFGTCTFTVTVTDDDPPHFINCPYPPVVLNAQATFCEAYVNFALPLATDNCDIPTVIQIDGTGLSTGDVFPVGTTVLYFEAIDLAGNSDTCQVKVIVNDIFAPEIICPADLTLNNDPWLCSAVVNDVAPDIASACEDNLAVTYSIFRDAALTQRVECGVWDASGEALDVGANWIRYTVQNQPLLLITEVSQSTATDRMEITNLGPADMDITCLVATRDATNNAADEVLPMVTMLPSLAGTIVPVGGTFVFDFTVNGAANMGACYTISYMGITLDEVAVNGFPGCNGFTGTLASGDVIRTCEDDSDSAADWAPAQNCVPLTIGALNPMLEAMPDNGTQTSLQSVDPKEDVCVFKVTVLDAEDPFCGQLDAGSTTTYTGGAINGISTATCNRSTITIPAGDCIIGNILFNRTGTATPANSVMTLIAPDGDSIIIAEIPDDSIAGLFAKKSAGIWTLDVVPTVGTPTVTGWSLTITCIEPFDLPNQVIGNDAGECGADFTWTHPYFLDNCFKGTISVAYTSADADCVPAGGPLLGYFPPENRVKGGYQVTEFFCVGTTTVTYTLTDTAGNVETCSFTVTVEDREDPVLVCPQDITVNLSGGECGAFVTFTPAVSTDNCAVVSVVSNPASGSFFEIGTTTVTITITDAAGNSVTCTFDVIVNEFVPTNHSLVCNDLSHVSMSESCEFILDADGALEGDNYHCYEDYIITIKNHLNQIQDNVFNASDIGKTFTVTVFDPETGNSCWTILVIEDKIAPTLTCPPNVTIACTEDTGVANTGNVGVVDCSPTPTRLIDDVFTDFGQCATPRARIVRTFIVRDIYNNQNTCVQTITINPFDFADLIFPDDVTIDCEDVYLNPDAAAPENTGYPSINGFPIGQGGLCMASINTSDEHYDICPGSYEILRTWRIRNMCLPLGPGNPQEHIQLIKVQDINGPQFPSIADITVSTDPSTCCATAALPDVIISEGCSNIISLTAKVTGVDDLTGNIITFTVNGQLHDFPGNNYWTPDTLAVFFYTQCLPRGTYLVQYRAEDQCSNISEESFHLTVEDLIPPVATCTQVTTVAINVDDPLDCYVPGGSCESAGVTWVPASAFNQGSYDNCNGLEFTIRRMPEADSTYSACIDSLAPLCDGLEYDIATAENDSIKFYCCEVGTTQTVILRVYQIDLWGNRMTYPDGEFIYNECMIQVTVQDKIAPTCQPPASVTVSCENFDPSLWAYGTPTVTDNCCLDETPPTAADPQGQLGIPSGTATIPEVCGATQKIYYNGFLNANFDTTCHRGIIIRRFMAWDCAGQSSSCTQRVTVEYIQDYNLVFPADVSVNCTAEPEIGAPIVSNDEGCELIGVSYNDVFFTIVPDACYKIERTWRIINWCTYNPDLPCYAIPRNPVNPVTDLAPVKNWRVYLANEITDENCVTYKQIIKVKDLTPPTVTCHDIDTCDYSTNNVRYWNDSDNWWDNDTQQHDLCEKETDISVTAEDLCDTLDVENGLRFRYLLFLDLDGDGIMETVVSSADALTRPLGQVLYNNYQSQDYHTGVPRYFDNNTNANQRYRFDIEQSGGSARVIWRNASGTKLPELAHGRHKIKWIAEDGCGNEAVCEKAFEIRDCKSPVVACADVNISLMVGGMSILWATDFYLYGEDNCTPASQLQSTLAVIRADENPSNTYPADLPQNVTVTCDDLVNGDSVAVQVWLMDAAGNVEYCVAYVVPQANMVGCQQNANNATVAGVLATEEEEGVESADVELAVVAPTGQQGVATLNSNGSGIFQFPNTVPMSGDYTLTPTKDDNPINGVTTYDLVLISKHILGLVPLTSPYKIIAADANRSGSVTTFDMVEFRKLILGLYTELPNNTSWRFVDKTYLFPEPTNPFSSQFPENISVQNVQQNYLGNDFVGVKIGDVNNSVLANSLQSAEERTAATMLFDVEDRMVKAGEVFTVNFKGAKKVQGYQFTMNLQHLEVMDITGAGEIKAEHFGVFDGAITTSVDGSDNEFAITFRATKAGRLSQMLGVSSRITKAEAYNANSDRLEVAFRFSSPAGMTISGVGFEVYQNQPNPFVNKTFIGFHLPEQAEATLKVYDEMGRMVFTQVGQFAKGHNAFSIDRQLITTTGVLYYTVETATDSATKKMIQSK